MAGDWIKMSVGLRSHPKVIRMASALRADKLRVIGGLFAVWGVFDTHSADGLLEGYTLAAMDDELGWRGFGAAMQSIGWLVESESGLEAPRFDEHNGASAKRRAMESERKRNARKGDECPPDVGEMSACDADKAQTPSGPEKRREEKNSPSLRSGEGAAKRSSGFDASRAELPDWLPVEDWQRWCADRVTRKKPVTEAAVSLQIAKLDGYRIDGHSPKDVIDHSIASGYQGLFAPSKGGRPAAATSKHAGFSGKDYREGVAEDGSLV